MNTLWSTKRMTQEEFCDFVKSLDGYMATEYVYAHSDLRKNI